MDPNTTVNDILDLRKELRAARDSGYSGYSDEDIQRVLDRIREQQDALRAWHRAGGFAPHIGWTWALSL